MVSAVNIPSLFSLRKKRLTQKRPFVDVDKQEWAWAGMFLLSMALLGLKFPFAIVFVGIIMINRLSHNMYDFVIMLTILCGGFGFLSDESLPIKPQDIAMLGAVAALFFYRKPLIVKLTVLSIALYGIALLILSLFSSESVSIQLRTMRNYLCFIYFIIPIVLFSGREFRFETFCRKLVPYAIVICIFYIIDGFILSGNFFVPRTRQWGALSTFFHPNIRPFSFIMARKYPPGLYLLVLCLLPSIRMYRFRPWQWAVIILALMSSKTFTVISGFVFAYFLFQKSYKRILKYGIFASFILFGLYIVDSTMPIKTEGDLATSTLRIKSSVDQFFTLKNATDEQEIANFGSGRFAQVMPNLEIIDKEGRHLTGLGFLHQKYTKTRRYQITNEYYYDISDNEEVAGKVEIIPLQIYLHVGLIGLAVHCLFLLSLYMLIRRLDHASYFLSVMFCLIWFGLGGFAGLIYFHGLSLLALAYSAVILDNREKIKGFSTPWIKAKMKDFRSRGIWNVNHR